MTQARLPLRSLPREAYHTVAALGVTVLVEIGLRALSLPHLAALVGAPIAWEDPHGPAGETTPHRVVLPRAARLRVRAARRVLRRWPFGDTCLREALVIGQRLRRLRPRLHVGVAKLDGEVRAHAWLVIEDNILDTFHAASSYLTLTSIPTGLGR